MLQKLKHITLFASLIVSGAMAATLEDIKYDPKSNGLMLSIEFSEPIPDDNITYDPDNFWSEVHLVPDVILKSTNILQGKMH